MKYSIFGYLIGEGFRNFFKNKKSTAASIIIMCATMFIFGIFFLIGENINYIMEQIQSEQEMQVFIDPEATPEEEAELEQKIKEIPYVNTTEYISKEEALNDVKSWSEDINKFLEDYTADGYNPFKASYVVTLTDLSQNDAVEQQIETFDHVADVEAGNQTVDKLVDIFIISNTIKLTVHARRKEISIMKYVGATNGFIRWPFMVEGIIIGIVSALISVVILGFAYNFIAGQIIGSSMVTTLNISLLTFSDMFSMLFIVYIIMGIGIGAIGSAISMKRYLEV